MKFTTVAAFGLVAASVNALIPVRQGVKVIPSQYIIIFKEGVEISSHLESLQQEMAQDNPANEILHQYEIGPSFRGYGIRCTEKILTFIRGAEDIVSFIEEDQFVSIFGQQTNPPSWGLDRISQRNLPLDNTFHYPNNPGSNVFTYTIDTGIRITHNDFGGRAVWGYNAVPGSTNDDLNGHGTHCTGTMIGTSYGIAKSARGSAVKVLGDLGFGSTDGVIAGVNWVTSQHNANGGPSVANMSLGGGASTALDNACNAAVAAGVHVAVAAGNDNANACNYSPARATAVVCVGSTTRTDQKSSFSNHGNCVEIHAPGSDITSAWITSNSSSAVLSGTSMASPHVAGVMAHYLGVGKQPTINVLQQAATSGVISGLPAGTVNYLLYTNENIVSNGI